MLTIPRRYVDAINIILILASCALAHALPYYLLLFSYAVLGPAHYLTQISWLHDRRYFVEASWLAPVFIVMAMLLAALFFYAGTYQIVLCAVLFALALGLAAMCTLPADRPVLRGIALAIALLISILAFWFPVTALFLSLMVPTVVHVFVFTGAFIWVGALKNRNFAAWLTLAALIGGAATFFIPGLADEAMPSHPGLIFFRPVIAFLQDRLGFSTTKETQLFGFLSFAYTYHYLNWFSKAEIIHWNKIPRDRMKAILWIYGMTLIVYFYNYIVGFLLIIFLAHLHVLLEFPLNMRSFASIARGKG